MTLAIIENTRSLIDNSNKKTCGGQTINTYTLREKDNAATDRTSIKKKGLLKKKKEKKKKDSGLLVMKRKKLINLPIHFH